MSTTDGGSAQEPGAVRAEPDPNTGQGGDAAGTTQPARAEAVARAEEIHAEVARTDARRAEEQAARADEAVEDAQGRQQEAHEAEERARSHARDVREDADEAAERAPATLSGPRPASPDDGGQPIVFGPFTAERPELLVAAAFVGGFLLAKIIRGLAS